MGPALMAAELAIAALVGFACGSIPFAVLVAKAMRLPDPRSYGSENPGATNVMRSGNKPAAFLVFALDMLKGVLPALACQWLLETEQIAAVAGVFAVAGHIFTPWLRFRGGRGVATGCGALLAIDWRVGIATLLVWYAIFRMTRTSSLASVGAIMVAMLVCAWQYEFGSYTATGVAAIALMIVLRHRQNFKALREGKERKF